MGPITEKDVEEYLAKEKAFKDCEEIFKDRIREVIDTIFSSVVNLTPDSYSFDFSKYWFIKQDGEGTLVSYRPNFDNNRGGVKGYVEAEKKRITHKRNLI